MCCSHSLCFFLITGILLVIILVLVFVLRYYFRLSLTDEMTSIPNYRGFRRKIKKVMASNKKGNPPFSIAIIDIDHFKRFNVQSYGLGDIVLKDFVKFIGEELPGDAFLARFRFGDEFIIILNCGVEEASEKIKKIWDKSRDTLQSNQQNKVQSAITFSFGVAGFDKESDSVESLMERAEKALKESKRNLEI